MYNLSFISEENFEKHVKETIAVYDKTLQSINLTGFNSNIVDPIKLLFDKNLFHKNFKEIIELEIHRQRDKSNTNAIGYFHQNIFKYIDNCKVPKTGWDVIVKLPSKPTIYVEMKNKHNTMNSSSSQKTYIGMQNQILKTPTDYCFLVETLAPVSRNMPWGCSISGTHVSDDRIRRVSMDQFYKLITGVDDAFFQMCVQLPKTLDKLIVAKTVATVKPDTVLTELHRKNSDTLKALYILAFESYEGFEKL